MKPEVTHCGSLTDNHIQSESFRLIFLHCKAVKLVVHPLLVKSYL